MSEESPSLWSLDRVAIEQSLVEGRSARREYSQADKQAIREVLDRPDFDHLSEHGRSVAFTAALERLGVVSIAPVAPAEPLRPGSTLAIVGWCLVVAAGVELAIDYFGYSTSVHSDMDYVAGSLIPARDTLNIGLLQNQLMLFQLGLAVLLAGLVFVALGMAVNALTPRDQV